MDNELQILKHLPRDGDPTVAIIDTLVDLSLDRYFPQLGFIARIQSLNCQNEPI